MKQIIFNNDNIKEFEVDEVIIRTKALIINSKNEVMLGYSDKTYQFPGGHLDDGETLEECLLRELKEETGIVFSNLNLTPFLKISYYTKNYRNTGKIRKNDIYFYLIRSDLKHNINNTSYDEGEISGNYVIKYIPLNMIDNVLIKSIKDNSINEIIVEEMLEVLKTYRELYIN